MLRRWFGDAVGGFESESGEQQRAVGGVVRRRCHRSGTVVALVTGELEPCLLEWPCRHAPHRCWAGRKGIGPRDVGMIIGPPTASAASGGTTGAGGAPTADADASAAGFSSVVPLAAW